MLYRQVKQCIILEELVVVIDLSRNEIAFPILVDVFGNRILQGHHQVQVFALDSDHELICRTKTQIRFFERLYAGSILRQQVRKIRIQFKAWLKQDRNGKKHRKNQVKGKSLVLVLANEGNVPIRKSFGNRLFCSHIRISIKRCFRILLLF